MVWVNAAECRLLGFSEAELLGRPVWELVAPEDRDTSRRAVFRKLGADGPLGIFERTLIRADGVRVVLEMHENHLRDEAGAIIGIRSFLIDITGRRQAEETLRRTHESLELRVRERTQELELAIEFLRREMDEHRLAEEERRKLEVQMHVSQHLESMGMLAGGVAHEFNNLLTSIMGYASLAMADLAEDAPARKNIGLVLAAAQHAAGLTQQMLAYSGRGKFVVEAFDVSVLLQGMARLLESMLRNKAALQLKLASDLPLIEADPAQVRQVVMNLFTNAADAVQNADGRIAISTGVVWAEAGELPPLQAGRVLCAGLYVYIEVCDTGCGMNEETLSKVFEPFFTTKFIGRGLGLAAVQGIMRGHRGSIQATTKLGEGSRFRVLFPATEAWEES